MEVLADWELTNSGLQKVQIFCRLAASRGFVWAWIDTCCIDKRSSSELTEAINSMFKWYKHSSECYVHMSDVEFTPHELDKKAKCRHDQWLVEEWPSFRNQFRRSSWFTRGWILQELLAPRKEAVFFFDARWEYIGDLSELLDDVSETTGIKNRWFGYPPTGFFGGMMGPSIAERMSWASRRHTSREEDTSYCLLGLFGINMPLLYSEGAKKAFYRLQVEILKETDDESLFAWAWPSSSIRGDSGIFAESPRNFYYSGDIISMHTNARMPYTVSHKGLGIYVPEKHISTDFRSEWPSSQPPIPRESRGDHVYCLLFLSCVRKSSLNDPLVIHLTETLPRRIVRMKCGSLDQSDMQLQSMRCTISDLLEDLRHSTLIHVASHNDSY